MVTFVNETDKYIYCKFVNQTGIIICLCMDDMLFIETSLEVVNGQTPPRPARNSSRTGP